MSNCVLYSRLCGMDHSPEMLRLQFRVALGTPCRSPCWCSCSSHKAHAILPLGPEQALMRLSGALAWASHTFCDSHSTCWMKSVPIPCGPASPI